MARNSPVIELETVPRTTMLSLEEAIPEVEEETSHTYSGVDESKSLNWLEHAASKWVLIVPALIPLGLAIAMMYLSLTNRSFAGRLLSFVNESRTSVQIIVTTIAGILSLMNLHVFVTVVRFAARIRLCSGSSSVNSLKRVEVLTKQQVVLVTRSPSLAVLSVFAFVLMSIPPIIWVGALTPVVGPSVSGQSALFAIPDYTPESAFNWGKQGGPSQANCQANFSLTDSVTSCPALSMSNQAITAFAHASVWKNSSDINGHAKADGSGYSYRGRSYGVAASVGLVTDPSDNALSYEYTEPGFHVKASCTKNTASAWGFELIRTGDAPTGIPDIYYALGHLPNTGDPLDFWAVASYSGSNTLVSYVIRNSKGQVFLAVAAQEELSWLNQTQCEFEFRPANFGVQVNTTERMIAVTPYDTYAPSFDAIPELICTVVNELSGISGLEMPLFASVVAEALTQDVNTWNNMTNAGQLGDNMTAIGDSFTAAIDDMLELIGAAQIRLKSGPYSQQVNASYTILSVSVGSRPYIVTAFGLSLALVVMFIEEAVRTQWWRNLPKFDFTDLICLLKSSWMPNDASDEAVSLPWNGSPSSVPSKKVRVKLIRDAYGISLVPQG